VAFCSSCGHPVESEWRFCQFCGRPVLRQADPVTSPLDSDSSPPPSAQPPDKPPRYSWRVVLPLVSCVVVLSLVVAELALLRRDHSGRQGEPLSAPTGAPPSTPTATTSPSRTFAELFSEERSGVVRIAATACGAEDIGTGFILRRDTVATVAHVVQDSVTIALTAGGQTTTGRVLGIDPSRELALIRADRRFPGHVFSFASQPPEVGDPVAAMGYPEGLPITFTQGTLSGLDRMIAVNGITLSGLIQTDTALNPGNSGGPLIDSRGEVVGLVEAKRANAEGIGYAINTSTAAPMLQSWEGNSPQAGASCPTPTGPSGQGKVGGRGGSVSTSVVATLSTYFNAINAADYYTAWLQFTPTEQVRVSVSHLANADATTFVFDGRLRSLIQLSSSTIIAYVTCTSVQAPGYGPKGETCDRWTLDYTMKFIGGSWLIDRAGPHRGSTNEAC